MYLLSTDVSYFSSCSYLYLQSDIYLPLWILVDAALIKSKSVEKKYFRDGKTV